MTTPNRLLQETDIPRSHAPALSRRGMFLLVVIISLYIAAFFFMNLYSGVFGVFLATAASFSLAAFSATYAAALILWRKARFGDIDYAFSHETTRFRLTPGQPVPLRLELKNGLKLPVNVRKITFYSTSHLRFDPDTKVTLKERSTTATEPVVTLAKRGPASIYAILLELSGPADLFVSDILISNPFNLDFLADSAALSHTHFSRNNALKGDPEFDTIRPYQRGDALNRIFWRGYAKTGDLVTRVFKPEKTTRHIAIFIDTTPFMTRAKTDEDTALFAILPDIKALSLSADEVTLVACTHDGCRILTRRTKPAQILEILDHFCLNAHLFEGPTHTQGWSSVVHALWSYHAFVHSLDFSFTINNKVMIDTRSMLQWMRADLLQTYPNYTHQLLRSSDIEIATIYAREMRLEIPKPSGDEKPDLNLAIKRISTFRPDLRPREIWLAGRNGLFKLQASKLQ